MPYSYHKDKKGEEVVTKKDSGEVVGHTTPGKLNAYLAALHIHGGDNAAGGGIMTPYPEDERSHQMKHEEGTEGSADEANDVEYDPMAHFDQGGFPGISSDAFDVSTGDSDTLKGSPLTPDNIPPAEPLPSAPVAQPPVKPQIQAPQPVSQPAAAPNAPQGSLQDALSAFLSQQRGGLEKYGPEQQMALQNSLMKERTSPLTAIGRGMAGLSDSIMQGVARAGPGNALKNWDTREENIAQGLQGTMAKANEQKRQQLQDQMKLSQEDPNSSLSKIAQQTEGPTLIQLGATKDQVAKMPASLIGDLLSKKITLQDALARIEETGTYQRGMLANTAQGRQLSATQAYEKMGTLGRLLHPQIAGQYEKAAGMGGGASPAQSFDTEAEAEAAHLPSGTVVTIGGRQARVK